MAKKQTDRTLTLLEMAADTVEALHEEMTDWQSNLEGNNMEHLPKYEQVTECVDALERADVRTPVDALAELLTQAADQPSDLGPLDLEVTVTYDLSTAKRKSRADRLGEAQGWLEQAWGALDDRLRDLRERARMPKRTSASGTSTTPWPSCATRSTRFRTWSSRACSGE